MLFGPLRKSAMRPLACTLGDQPPPHKSARRAAEADALGLARWASSHRLAESLLQESGGGPAGFLVLLDKGFETVLAVPIGVGDGDARLLQGLNDRLDSRVVNPSADRDDVEIAGGLALNERQ